MMNNLKKYPYVSIVAFYVFSFCLFFLLYGQVLAFDYVWDDRELFVYNPELLNNPLSWQLIARPVLEGTSYFRPLVHLSWFSEFHLFGLRPRVSHGINLAVFYMGALLLFHLVKFILRKTASAGLIAGISALIYLCHPMNIEATAWVAGRFDTFATFFLILATYSFLAVRPGMLRALLVLLAYVAALGSKETGILFLPSLFCTWVLAHHSNSEPWSPVFKSFFVKNYALLVNLLGLTIIYLFIRAYYASGMTHLGMGASYIYKTYIINQIPVISIKEYITRTLLPFYDLGLFFPIEYFVNPLNKIVSWAVCLFVASVVFFGFKRRMNFVFAILGYLIMISLVIYLIPISTAANIVQDRFLSPAMPFFIILVALGLSFLAEKRKIIAISAGMFYAASITFITIQLVPIWQNELKFWYHISIFQEKYNHIFHPMLLRAMMEFNVPRKDIEELMSKEREEIKRTGVFRPITFIMYGQYLVDQKDPEGIKLLREYSDILDEIGETYQVEGLSRRDVFAIYYSYALGLLEIEHNIKESAAIFEKAKKYNGPYKTTSTLALDIILNLLQNKNNEAKESFHELMAISNIAHEDFIGRINEKIKINCAANNLNIPACQPDFDVRQLENK
jgi:putative membrane protein